MRKGGRGEKKVLGAVFSFLGYDNLRRLTGMHRGELVDAKDRITDPKLTQNWQLDPTGNWKSFSNFDQNANAKTLVQQRTANAANEITDVAETVGPQWKTLTHDRNGNMIIMPNAKTPTDGSAAKYDAWNRLVKIETDDTIPVPIAHYQYDGLGRRTRKYIPGSTNSYQHFYYNAAWQILETRESSSSSTIPTTAQYQYVWSLRYIDAPILRDTDPSSTASARHYYSTDANFNVTALYEENEHGMPAPVERYTYDPYGNVTIYNVDWTATRTTSLYNNSTLYTGQWHDPETGLMNYRNRYYHPTLGRFLTRDPIGYQGGINLYAYVGARPIVLVDSYGLDGEFSNSDNASWKDFKKVDKSPDGQYSALTSMTLGVKLGPLEFFPSRDCIKVDASRCRGIATRRMRIRTPNTGGGFDYHTEDQKCEESCDECYECQAGYPEAKFIATFDRENSWVVKKHMTDHLLEHERRHIRLAEVYAAAGTQTLRLMRGNGLSCSLKSARYYAQKDLNKKKNSFISSWSSRWKAKDELYDSLNETNHGLNKEKQWQWEMEIDFQAMTLRPGVFYIGPKIFDY